MYSRLRKWIAAITPTTKAESGWENTFTLEEEDAVDIRFTLTGYGWKPGAGDTSIKSLEKGSYKIYYRLAGSPTWIFHAKVESDRNQDGSSTIYKRVGVALGLQAPGQYEIKIVADKGPKFTAWGGAIEGIVSGGQFWDNLQARVTAYKMAGVNDEITITENAGATII